MAVALSGTLALTGTSFSPLKFTEISRSDARPAFKGYAFTAAANTTTNYDIAITDDTIFEGGRFIGQNLNDGDYIDLYVIDKDNILGGGVNAVVLNPVSTWYIAAGESVQWDFSLPYPQKFLGGLYLRVSYTNTSLLVAAPVKFNLKKHTILW